MCEDSQYFLATTMRQRQRHRQWSVSGTEDCDSEALIQSIRCPLPVLKDTARASKAKNSKQNLPRLF